MRAAFHLLVLACLIWCALGISEPVQAYAGPGVAAAGGVDPADPLLHDEDGEQAAGHHHHCPVAPDLPPGCAPSQAVKYRDPVFTPRFGALDSLTRAPPLQPPATA